MIDPLPTQKIEFRNLMLVEVIKALKLNRFFDNYDDDMVKWGMIKDPMAFDPKYSAHHFLWFLTHLDEIFSAYERLSDNRSRELYLYLIAYRMGGHLSIKLPVDYLRNKAALEAYRNLEAPQESTYSGEGQFDNLRHFDFLYEGKRYTIDCYGLEYYLFRKQYFLSRNTVSVMPEPGDVVIDGGACLGDSALVFSHAVGPSGHVFAFDPVQEHLDILDHNLAQFPEKNVTAIPAGLSDKEVQGQPISLGSNRPGFKSRKAEVPLRSIDGLMRDGLFERLDFIKLDVEGEEINVLDGAYAAIERWRPKLAISIYHGSEHFYAIPNYIAERFPFYDLFVDHYTIHKGETVLYCTDDRSGVT